MIPLPLIIGGVTAIYNIAIYNIAIYNIVDHVINSK